jgi:hypothetical protein
MSRVVTVFGSKGGREVLTLVVLVILAALWAVVLVPPLLLSRTARVRTSDSIGDFNYRLDVLGRTNGTRRVRAASLPPVGRAARRRRDVLRGLLIAVAGSGLLALATNTGVVWALFGLTVLALGAFFGLWAYARQLHNERAAKVHPMRRHPSYQARERRLAASS